MFYRLSRETRSTSDVDEINKTKAPNSDLPPDDDDYNAGGRTSGDDFSSGDSTELSVATSIEESSLSSSSPALRGTCS